MGEVAKGPRERGIGVMLYVNRRALERQLDALLPIYQAWCVKGIKFGFVNVGTQKWTAWLHEAVRGSEEMPRAAHNVILPFTRYLCGAVDYTVCWYDHRIKTTHSHQLAASAVYSSPLQFLFWYDPPAQCQWEPELEFFKQLPTAWDETRVVSGEIGRFITTARRKGSDWFVGTMNDGERRQLDIPLSFLKPDQPYNAWVYRDARPDGSAPREVALQQVSVDATTILHADLAASGGQAVRIVPAADQAR
jgi:alpha-glucosidase